MIVVDANLVAYYTVPGARTAVAERVRTRDSEWCAPFLLRSELRNVLAGLVRRRELGLDLATEMMAAVEDLLREREFDVPSNRVLDRAAFSGCTAYDCEYVVLAEELGVPLVTSDRQVLRAFPKLAVSLEGFVRQ